MTSIKEEAQAYNPSSLILNIADLFSVEVNLEIYNENDVEFPYKYILKDGKRYRVPVSVLTTLKAILEENPRLQKFKVKKSGEGMNTNYTVIPLN